MDELRTRIAELEARTESRLYADIYDLEELRILRAELAEETKDIDVWEVAIYGIVPLELHDEYVVLEVRIYVPMKGVTEDEVVNDVLEYVKMIGPKGRFIQAETGINRVNVAARRVTARDITLEWEQSIADVFNSASVRTYVRKKKEVRAKAEIRREHEAEYKRLTGEE